jgi:hypothetical protein
LDDGAMLVNTTDLGKDITGYGGNVPLEITIRDNRVTHVKALKNSETPEFFGQASRLLTKWNGKTVDEAEKMKVDAVSGATFSSKAIIGNMQRGLSFAQKNRIDESASSKIDLSLKAIAGLLVVLLAAVLPLFVKNRRYHFFQMALNVIVLGFWCGSCISYSALIGYVSNGMNVLTSLIPTVMLITAFLYPLFGKKSYYCTHVCPYGSLQQLAGRCVKNKKRISPYVQRRLGEFRKILWAMLMLSLLTGVWSDWIDYEPFSAFVFQSASWISVGISVAFVVLSMVVTRPYCRFVCPMGTLLKFSQYSKKHR